MYARKYHFIWRHLPWPQNNVKIPGSRVGCRDDFFRQTFVGAGQFAVLKSAVKTPLFLITGNAGKYANFSMYEQSALLSEQGSLLCKKGATTKGRMSLSKFPRGKGNLVSGSSCKSPNSMGQFPERSKRSEAEDLNSREIIIFSIMQISFSKGGIKEHAGDVFAKLEMKVETPSGKGESVPYS